MKTSETPMEVEPSADSTVKEEKKAEKDADTLTLEDIREQCKSIERGEQSKEPRYVARVLRSLITTRKKLNSNVLQKLVSAYFGGNSVSDVKEALLKHISSSVNSLSAEAMDIDKGSAPPRSPKPKRVVAATAQQILPEVETYIHLLVLLYLVDQKKFDIAETSVHLLMDRIQHHNRRTLDPLSAKAYYYYALIHERTGKLSSIRQFLQGRLKTATLRRDEDGQATLINCLLRSYLAESLADMAGKLVDKVTFPESASNNEWARYFYYLASIKALQLDYAVAHKHLQLSLRKSPQTTGVGFKQAVQKLTITVELLLGETPDRNVFRQPIYKRALQAYLQLTQAVRNGDLLQFDAVLARNGKDFQADNTKSLIVRLRQNVIKTAVKQISLAYSRISIPDIEKKLHPNDPHDVEHVVSKCILDGHISAVVNNDEGYMQSRETSDIYASTEPQSAYHNRINFCLEIYNQSVKAMRFPPKSYNKDLESAEERREREQQDLEFAKEMAEEEDDFA